MLLVHICTTPHIIERAIMKKKMMLKINEVKKLIIITLQGAIKKSPKLLSKLYIKKGVTFFTQILMSFMFSLFL